MVATVLFLSGVSAAPEICASCSILIDADTGRILYANNANQESLIASTTKIMTAVVVLEHCDINAVYEIPPEATGIEGSSVYLKPGEKLTIEELLYCMMLQSGNDAAVALALACSDSVPEFVDLMNLKAQELSLHQTHFENPNGLDGEDHHSSAADLAHLTQYALQNPAFEKIVSTKTITIGHRRLSNHNRLLWSLDGAIGVKTGYTRAAGRILVSAAERNGRRLIAVTINDGNDWNDHALLYDYGFSQYEDRVLICAGEAVGWVELVDGTRATLTAAVDISYPACENEEVRVAILSPRYAFCAGLPGRPAGSAAVYIGTRQIGFLPLNWGEQEEAHAGTTAKNIVCPRPYLPTRCGEAAF